MSLRKPPAPAPTENVRQADLVKEVLMIKVLDWKRDEDGKIDNGSFDRPAPQLVTEVHVLEGDHAGSHLTNFWLGGATVNDQLKDSLGTDEWTVVRLMKDGQRYVLHEASAAAYTKAEQKLSELNGDKSQAPPF